MRHLGLDWLGYSDTELFKKNHTQERNIMKLFNKCSVKDLSLAIIAIFCIYSIAEQEIGYVSLGYIGNSLIESRHFTLKNCRENSRVVVHNLVDDQPNKRWEEFRPEINTNDDYDSSPREDGQPNYGQYRSRAMAAASAGDKERAKAILLEAKALGLKPKPKEYNLEYDALKQNGRSKLFCIPK